ncbi:translation elongation factor EF-2 [Methanocaldococcus jannaschii DSM 2661]|uniref:Elongation factor 2 n=1 Tax=Methanocaldococcus jannaschii (strain ATCC 43067 / DSM 2661 / JAL-1 / JCM 10045 / NBRC 100440) TaxID=243232 RepID=EF2_METJA|nr:elongation factor EF-2 [Methanocaldococcus jannaschii]Q58448.1 RecName: Full=Elongation factor 2; Short=EF-2 [Methanocaldococcus jannaschii DSM 2661]AAB99052.1 translation elongation factor EF-2 [Methanocaldococcus jannaschii DSM 2661]
MGKRAKMIAKIKELMEKYDRIRNIGICAHIDHGKTTLSDNLLAGAGMISKELAGEQLALDFDEEEAQRGITIFAANVSMVHTYEGNEYLINLIDTPGHVDFGGDVTRAMRAIDGAIVVVCAVEGVMPQTETVLRQALRERVKPVLFINKVDRLINELKLTPEELQSRFIKIINDINNLIRKMAPEEFKDKWLVRVEDGSVAFGSAYNNWAISVPFMKKSGITFKDIIKYCEEDRQDELAEKAPLHEVVLDMVIKHLPSPPEAQKYRIPHLWKGDLNSEAGKAMLNCDPNGPLAGVITKIIVDKHAGAVSVCRLFSGRIKQGDEVYMVNNQQKAKIQQVSVFMGPERIPVDSISAGNICALVGLKEASAGETICSPDKIIEPFEAITHISEPVITVAIEAKNTKDLPKLIEVLRQVAREDPTVKVEINEETGEHLLSGMGELHIEIITKLKIERDAGIPVEVGQPIVVYRETVTGQSPVVESKSPNKHNKLYFVVEPLEESVLQAYKEGRIPDVDTKRKLDDKIVQELIKAGMDPEEAKRVMCIYEGNVLINMTRGIVHLDEVKELIIQGFKEAMRNGPLAAEKCQGVKVKLMDAVLHEDAIHRGPAQMIPAARFGIRDAMMQANPVLLEPMQFVYINTPQDFMGAAMREISNRRGQILDMEQEGDMAIIKAKCPVAEMFGFAGAIRGATQGRCLWSIEFAGYEKVPRDMQEQLIKQIRERKGLKLE